MSVDDPDVYAAALAAEFAQAIQLAPGNHWEAAIARNIATRIKAGEDRTTIRMQYMFQLGLARARRGSDGD